MAKFFKDLNGNKCVFSIAIVHKPRKRGEYSSHRFVGKATGAAELAQVLMEVKEKYGEELFNGAEVEVDVQDYFGGDE